MATEENMNSVGLSRSNDLRERKLRVIAADDQYNDRRAALFYGESVVRKPLLSRDYSEIKPVADAAREVWTRSAGSRKYTREDFERDRVARKKRRRA